MYLCGTEGKRSFLKLSEALKKDKANVERPGNTAKNANAMVTSEVANIQYEIGEPPSESEDQGLIAGFSIQDAVRFWNINDLQFTEEFFFFLLSFSVDVHKLIIVKIVIKNHCLELRQIAQASLDPLIRTLTQQQRSFLGSYSNDDFPAIPATFSSIDGTEFRKF